MPTVYDYTKLPVASGIAGGDKSEDAARESKSNTPIPHHVRYLVVIIQTELLFIMVIEPMLLSIGSNPQEEHLDGRMVVLHK